MLVRLMCVRSRVSIVRTLDVLLAMPPSKCRLKLGYDVTPVLLKK
jgi:hypothetical protein